MGRWEPPAEQVVEGRPTRPRWPLVVLLLAILAVAAIALTMFWGRLHPSAPELLATAADVRSSITGQGDTLDVVVSWRLEPVSAVAMADSVRVEVGIGNGTTSAADVAPGDRHTDTLRLTVAAGPGAITGYSCVAVVLGVRLTREACTPWQYVRPAAETMRTPVAPDTAVVHRKSARVPVTTSVTRIVIAPTGQQVDPDIDGKCAAWQREHPDSPVWIRVNERAVPACMGPNGKPTVAQFCAFAELSDGRRVKTTNSADNPYCEQLYQDWIRQRVT
jgi:hypothetical protein